METNQILNYPNFVVNEEMKNLVQHFNWNKTSLGDMKGWAPSLQTAVSICLNSKLPILILWGNDLIHIYNDGYREIIGVKHPKALGSSALEVWKELWSEIGPLLNSVLKEGKSFTFENRPFVLERNGVPQECFFTFSYSPIYEGEQKIAGVFVSIIETTQVVNNEKHLRTLRNQQLNNLFIQAPVAMAILKGQDFIVETANEKILELWGKSLEDVLDKPVFDAVNEARGQGFEKILSTVYTNGERYVIHEIPLTLTRNGVHGTFFIKVVYEPLRESDGTVSGIMVLADEITEQVNIRKKIEESEIRLKIAIEAANIGTYDLNLQQGLFEYSNRVAEIFGYKTKDYTHHDFVNRVHPDDLSLRMKAHQTAYEKGVLSYEARLVWPDNTIRWARFNGKVIFTEDGKPERMYGTVLDITDQKTQAEQLERLVEERTLKLQQKNIELIHSEERYHKMVAEVKDYAIILLDKNGIVQNWNKGAEQIKGYKEEEIIGKHFQTFYLPEDRKNNLPQRLMHLAVTEGRAKQEGWRMRKDGSKFWGSIVITALYDGNELIGFSKVTRDLTERKLAEDKIMEYTHELEAQNKELEQFAYIASHDLQEPLRKIQTFSELILQNIKDEKVITRYFEKINFAAHRMSLLIKSVLNYSRLSHNNELFIPVDLNTILAHVKTDFELMIAEKDAVIQADPLPVIQGIPLQLSQLFSNLIGNSLKFTETKPIITITSKIVTTDQIINKPKGLPKEKYLALCFSDNGIGFEQQYEKQIFTIFQRLHGKQEFPGTGIGLSLCKKIVENHKGFITAKGELGKGASFYIYLPLEP